MNTDVRNEVQSVRMHGPYALLMVALVQLSVVSHAQEDNLGHDAGALAVWQRLAEEPLEVVVAVKNAMTDSTIYVGQPMLLNVGLRNLFAEEIAGATEEQKALLTEDGLDLSASVAEVCEDGVPWTSFVKICIGVERSQPRWEGALAATSKRRSSHRRVDRNPVSTMEYLVLGPDLAPGDYLLWAEFQWGYRRGKAAAINKATVLSSDPIALRLSAPTNAQERAWAFAEKGAMLKRADEYMLAEEWYKKALREYPSLSRGPKIQGTRRFNLSWELVGVYEATSRHEDAMRAVQQTREYLEARPSEVQKRLLEELDGRRPKRPGLGRNE